MSSWVKEKEEKEGGGGGECDHFVQASELQNNYVLYTCLRFCSFTKSSLVFLYDRICFWDNSAIMVEEGKEETKSE